MNAERNYVSLLIECWGLFHVYHIWGIYFQSQVIYLIKIIFKTNKDKSKKSVVLLSKFLCWHAIFYYFHLRFAAVLQAALTASLHPNKGEVFLLEVLFKNMHVLSNCFTMQETFQRIALFLLGMSTA